MDLHGRGELSRETLELIIEHSKESIFVTDASGRVILVNPVACELLGFSKEELMGKSVQQLLQGGYYEGSAVIEAMKSNQTSMENIHYRDGTASVSTSTPVFDKDGNLKLVITNSSGESRIKMLQSLVEAERREVTRYKREVEHLRRAKDTQIIAESLPMCRVLEAACVAAETDTPVILIGETGVGKDVVANFIHRESRRHECAFVDINCAAMPDSLMEAELFGYEKGAFTGAGPDGKAGLLEVASGGTFFLDEIGEMPLALQAKLLRVLETREFRRIGGTSNLSSDARIVCATNRNLEQMVQEKTFRADLFYRLNILQIDIPPLRERKADIRPLALRFLADQNEKYGTQKEFSQETLVNMERYSWPGNIRELRNVVVRTYFLAKRNQLHWDFRLEPAVAQADTFSGSLPVPAYAGMLREFRSAMQNSYIEFTLRACDGNMEEAARRLGIHRSQLYRLVGQKKRRNQE